MSARRNAVPWWVWVLLPFAVLAVWSYRGTLDPPSTALLEWTEWLASVVAIVVAARVVWAGASLMRKKAGLTP